jgi:hypothetical protein
MTGDFVSRVRDIPKCEKWIRQLTRDHRVIGVLGNHDYWTHVKTVTQAMRWGGVELLVNQRTLIKKGGQSLMIIGLDDLWKGLKAPASLWEGKGFKIVLAHTPDQLRESVGKSVEMQLSGHTHAGQIRFPLIGPIFIPSLYSRKFDRGFFQLQHILLYVSQGIGGLPPFRLNCRPEISTFVLRRKKA